MVRTWGPRQSDILRRRLDQLRAAPALVEMRSLPGRCHELIGDRAGQLSLDLVHPMRLIFESADEPTPINSEGGLDWAQVKTVRILEIADTHD